MRFTDTLLADLCAKGGRVTAVQFVPTAFFTQAGPLGGGRLQGVPHSWAWGPKGGPGAKGGELERFLGSQLDSWRANDGGWEANLKARSMSQTWAQHWIAQQTWPPETFPGC